MKLIHAADIHLGSPLGGLDQHDDLPVKRIREAPMRAFERLVGLCEREHASMLVIAGDLFDGHADLPTMRGAARVLIDITRAGTKVVLICGNHDADSKMQRRLQPINGVVQLPTDRAGSAVFEDLGIAVHGRGFDTPSVPHNIVPDYPAALPGLFNVGLLHTSLTGAEGHDSYAPCAVSDLAALGYQYWALGHVHKRKVHDTEPWIIFPGNVQGRDVGEVGAHGVTVVEYADGNVVGEPRHVDLDVVRWHVVDLHIGEIDDAAALMTLARERLAALLQDAPEVTHIARIVITERGPAHNELTSDPGHWRAQLHDVTLGISPDALYLEQVRIRTLPELPDRDALLAREDFIGDATHMLLGGKEGADHTGNGDDDTPPDDALPEGTFDVLDKKLGALKPVAYGGPRLREQDSDDELDAAREALLARLLLAHAQDAQGVRS